MLAALKTPNPSPHKVQPNVSPTAVNQTTPEPTRKPANANRENSKSAAPFNWTRLNTILLTLFNAILAIVAVYQYRLTRRQTDLTEKGMKLTQVAADASKQSADAAMRAVEQSDRSTSITQRALILIESVTSEPEFSAGERQGYYFHGYKILVFTLKNYGATVAYNVNVTGEVKFGEKSLGLNGAQGMTLAPKGLNKWITKSLGGNIPSDEIEQTTIGKRPCTYWVEVKYNDAFGNPHKYRSEGQFIAILRTFITGSSISD
ncbi:MAG TPA: hypothetical protein VK581_03090 [Chthoniobacterales bacterium]|nr:hypothetical protein [Chthoniobacterales bacterium]